MNCEFCGVQYEKGDVINKGHTGKVITLFADCCKGLNSNEKDGSTSCDICSKVLNRSDKGVHEVHESLGYKLYAIYTFCPDCHKNVCNHCNEHVDTRNLRIYEDTNHRYCYKCMVIAMEGRLNSEFWEIMRPHWTREILYT